MLENVQHSFESVQHSSKMYNILSIMDRTLGDKLISKKAKANADPVGTRQIRREISGTDRQDGRRQEGELQGEDEYSHSEWKVI